MSRANVPKFGNWENEDDVPYTVYFEKARKNRGGDKMINPNDPQENPDLFPTADTSPPQSKPNRRGSEGPMPESQVSKEDAEFRHSGNSPVRGEAKTVNEPNYGGGHGQKPSRPARPSGGSEQSFERSPLHPHYQAKAMARGSGSPAREAKNHDSSHGTPGRSRLKPSTRGDESPDKAAAVPRFGEWDENDPQSAENFTHIFNEVRNERRTGAGNVTGTPKHSSYGTHGQRANQPKKCCCGWW